MVDVAAQTEVKSTDKGWPVSKDVQRYSNKTLHNYKPTKIKSLGTPSFAQSKEVHRSKPSVVAARNIRSSGTPNWVISKPVNLINR